MGVEIVEDVQHLGVAGVGVHAVAPEKAAVHRHHQLGEQRLLQQRAAEAPLHPGPLQPAEQLPYAVTRRHVEHVAELLLGQSEAPVHLLAAGQAAEIGGGDVEYHPLVEVAVGHLRAVDAAPAHQYAVAALQVVVLALHGVIRPAGQQENNLMKGMIVKRKGLPGVVRQVEKAEILVEIAPLFIL